MPTTPILPAEACRGRWRRDTPATHRPPRSVAHVASLMSLCASVDVGLTRRQTFSRWLGSVPWLRRELLPKLLPVSPHRTCSQPNSADEEWRTARCRTEQRSSHNLLSSTDVRSPQVR